MIKKSGQAGDIYLEYQERYKKMLQVVDRGTDTYWLSQPLRTGIGHRHNVKIEGGDKSFRYSATLQYNKAVGVMKESDRTNFNGGLNLSYHRDNLIFRNSLTIGVNKAKNSPYGNFSDYVKLNPYWRPYDDKGRLIKELENSVMYSNKPVINPMYNATLNTINSNDYTNIINNFSIDWRPVEGLSLLGKVGISSKVDNSDDFKPAEHTDFATYTGERIVERGLYNYSTGKNFNYDVSVQVNYSKLLAEKHLFTIGLNFDATQQKSQTYRFSVQGFPHESIDFLASALQYSKDSKPSGSESTTRRVGIVGNVAYSYADRYLFDFSYRTDGSSQFGANQRFAPFLSTGIGWNIHKEKFMSGVSFINQLKIRASYGMTGSQNFSAYQAVETYRYYLDKRYLNWMGAFQVALCNNDLEWQKTDKYNIGLDASFFNGRFSLSGNIYLHKTNNLLSSLELPYSNGFTDYSENIGAIENKGFDLRVSGHLIRNTEHQVFWTATANLAQDKNKIVKLSEVMKKASEELQAEGGANPNQILREGDSQNAIYSVRSLGIDPSTGKELYLNRFGEVTYDWDARDRVKCGVGEPTFRGNLSSMFRYKDFSINVSFGYEWGGQSYNSTLISSVENADTKYNVDRRVYEDRWMQPGDVTFFKGLKELSATQHTSRFIQDERIFRCQNINVTYDIRNKKWLQRCLGIQSLGLSGNMGDIFYLSSIRQERGTSYPFSRSFSLSLAVMFR